MEVSDQHHAPAALPSGIEPRYPVSRRQYWPQNQSGSGRIGEEKISCPCRNWSSGRAARHIVAATTTLSRLLSNKYFIILEHLSDWEQRK